MKNRIVHLYKPIPQLETGHLTFFFKNTRFSSEQFRRLLKIRFVALVMALLVAVAVPAAETVKQLFAHPTVEDEYGVITPWYGGQNGQFDNRVRIAAETIKRYPWIAAGQAPARTPEFVFNSTWRIDDDGKISVPLIDDWANGVMGQNAARMLNGLVDYYQYSGDAAALALMTMTADTFLQVCLTSPNHPWPEFPISVPVKGKPYGQCDPSGWIQLDIVGELGLGMLRAYQVTGNQRWLAAVTHWGEVLAAKRNRAAGAEPWSRYANPEDVDKWNIPEGEQKRVGWSTHRDGNVLEGSTAYILALFDELIRLGQHGADNDFEEARAAGQAYFRDRLLPRWYINSTWGHNYWDWEAPTQLQTTSDWAMRYVLAHKDVFPNWRNDVRNILSLFLNHTSADPASKSETYSGAWAFPESSSCCRASLAWGPMEFALVLARYGVEADSKWGRELARRMAILSTYDAHETGVVEDDIDGGVISAGKWFIGTHPSALAWVLKTMGWLPEILGANRENHIMRSTGVVNKVNYRKGRVVYSTFDAPAGIQEVLRLAFSPKNVEACGKVLKEVSAGDASYTSESLKGGDYLVTIRHTGCTDILVEGDDPQLEEPAGGRLRYAFNGNQVRLLGTVGPEGGRADVYLDGEKQLAGIDFWNPKKVRDQVVYYRNGLSSAQHELRVEPQGQNPLSSGNEVMVEWVQSSQATGESGVGVGGGPTDTQRMVFGYTERDDYVDAAGNRWRPGTELVTRAGRRADTVAKTWWTIRQAVFVKGTPDDTLYQYGVHWPEIIVNVTVGPGTYYVRLKLAETQYTKSNQRAMSVYINGQRVAEAIDVYATAGSENTAVDLVYEGIQPQHGIIEVRLQGESLEGRPSEAMLQALEVGMGPGGESATAVQASVK